MGSPMLHPYTTNQYDIPKDNHLKLEIYSILGQRVRTLVNENKTTGRYQVKWDGKYDAGVRMPSGIYCYVLNTPEYQQRRKMLMIH